jgi:hypothetical protein
MMVSLADGGGSDGGCRHQLNSGGWCPCHHPFIGVEGIGKDAITAATINRCFHRRRLLLPQSTATIAAAAQLTVNGGGGLCRQRQQRQGQMQVRANEGTRVRAQGRQQG